MNLHEYHHSFHWHSLCFCRQRTHNSVVYSRLIDSAHELTQKLKVWNDSERFFEGQPQRWYQLSIITSSTDMICDQWFSLFFNLCVRWTGAPSKYLTEINEKDEASEKKTKKKWKGHQIWNTSLPFFKYNLISPQFFTPCTDFLTLYFTLTDSLNHSITILLQTHAHAHSPSLLLFLTH